MASKATGTDQFAQLAALTTVESAANTLTYAKLDVVAGAMLGSQKYGMILHRIEAYVDAGSMSLPNAGGDFVSFGLTVANNMTTISMGDPAVITFNLLERPLLGAGGQDPLINAVFVADYTNMPSGGLILSADRIFGFVQGNGCASAARVVQRIFYTMRELSVQDYWDLVEARRIITN